MFHQEQTFHWYFFNSLFVCFDSFRLIFKELIIQRNVVRVVKSLLRELQVENEIDGLCEERWRKGKEQAKEINLVPTPIILK